MKDLIIVISTTLIAFIIWTAVETNKVANQSVVPKDLLEISLPINGRIDTEYLDSLKEPVHEP
jgi:hypothetical protein